MKEWCDGDGASPATLPTAVSVSHPSSQSLVTDERIADGNHQDRKEALHNSVNRDLGEIEHRRMVELVLRLPKEDRTLGRKGIHHAQHGKEELGKDQKKAGEEPRLKAGHVPFQLQEDQANEDGGGHRLHRTHHRQSLAHHRKRETSDRPRLQESCHMFPGPWMPNQRSSGGRKTCKKQECPLFHWLPLSSPAPAPVRSALLRPALLRFTLTSSRLKSVTSCPQGPARFTGASDLVGEPWSPFASHSVEERPTQRLRAVIALRASRRCQQRRCTEDGEVMCGVEDGDCSTDTCNVVMYVLPFSVYRYMYIYIHTHTTNACRKHDPHGSASK